MHTNGQHPDSTIFSISDRELLFVVQDLQEGDDDRRVQTSEIVERLGLTHEHAARSIGSRLGYMRRIGLVERETNEQRWRLTAMGTTFILGILTEDELVLLDRLGLSPGRMLQAVSRIGTTYRNQEGTALATGMRRQWRNSTGRY